MHTVEIHSRYDKLSLLVILLSILVFTLETLPGLSEYRGLFEKLEIFFVIIFTYEYLYRIWKSPKKLHFITSFYGIVDLLAILPFYLSLGFADLRWVRVLRVLRVFMIFKLGRYVVALNRIKEAVSRIKEELLVFLIVSFILIYLAAVGVYFFERDAQPEAFASIVHALWFAAVTLTTVGYGDITPVTPGGRFFTGLILLLGLGLISIPSGLLAGSFSEIFKREKKDENVKQPSASSSVDQ